MEYLPCQPSPDCKYFPRCREDVHHRAYPRADYKTPLERVYRELDENKQLNCRAIHEEIHATESVPPKPERQEMLDAVSRAVIYLSQTKQRSIYGT